MKRVAVYAGTFDPITKGHLAVVDQGLSIADEVHILVSVNPDKKPMFDEIERQRLIKRSLESEFGSGKLDRIVVGALSGGFPTVEYAKLVDACMLIRGLRNGADYAYERSQAMINKMLAPNIETVFLQTPVKFEEVSSSTVKKLMKIRGGEVAAHEFVTPAVLEALRSKSYF